MSAPRGQLSAACGAVINLGVCVRESVVNLKGASWGRPRRNRSGWGLTGVTVVVVWHCRG